MRRNNRFVVGITGGSGVGKSHLAGLFKERGYTVIDADDIAREVMNKGEECLLETVREFGEEILEEGHLNRKKLAKIVFSDAKKLDKLNQISHKYILKRIEDRIDASTSKIVFVDGAVLLESGFLSDVMIGVIADYDERKKRIMLRDGLSEEEAKRRLDAQQKDEFYYKNCDFVIESGKDGFDIESILKRIEE